MSEQAQTESNAGAFYGLLGNFVRIIEPHTEADPLALLVQGLVMFGHAVGPGPYFTVESTRHRMNEFVCIVGATGHGRKGTSYGRVHDLFDTAGIEMQIVHGLSSGEGLIWAVRDGAGDDPGVKDKRLLVVEPEFASVLRVMGRDGNTLSATIRQGWDGGNLRTLTKNSPAKASQAHISLISHVSRPELRRYLTSTEAGNGFGNRILWMCCSRSKLLPEGGNPDAVELIVIAELARQLSSAFIAASPGRIERDDDARALWRSVYPELTADRPGLFGAVTSRAEAHVTRLSCIYALLDESAVVRLHHLKAALALWAYSESSARRIFGDALGDPIADEILRALKLNVGGLSRTDISNLFGRHMRADAISSALETLQAQGLTAMQVETTGGRPIERWTAKQAKDAKEQERAVA